jgi:hypothetical protein
MAVSEVQTNNRLVEYTQEIAREYVRENLFSPYMGTGLDAIIRLKNELKSGGQDMNIPLVTSLKGTGVGAGTLVGNEEAIDDYGMRLRVGWARNAVVTKKSEQQKDYADIFGEAKPLLTDWGKERQRDDIINAMMSIPSETPPSSDDVTVNGIMYEAATAAQRNAFNVANSDRILFGAGTGNYNATHATALANLDTTNDRFTGTNLKLLKRLAKNANPRIRPYKTSDGREYFVAFAGSFAFRDIQNSLETINKDARSREGRGMDDNPLFQDGDLLYDGVIIREIPEISQFVTTVWTTLLTAGNSSTRVEPVFFCGQSAIAYGWGQMPRPTERKEDDYGFIKGVGVEMAYGVEKMFKLHPKSGTALKQWGMATGFFSAPSDA